MLGNDIIDLGLAAQQSNWRRKHYLAKIFTPAEQLKIKQADDPDLMVWLLWSMKEAAYKIVNRDTGIRFFKPQALVCNCKIGLGLATGTVTYQQKVFATVTEIKADFIHTLALADGLTFAAIEIIYCANQAAYLPQFNLDHPSLSLQKNRQLLPEIYHREKKMTTMATISHHGSRLGVAFLKFSD